MVVCMYKFIYNRYLFMWYLICQNNTISGITDFKDTINKKQYFLLIKEKDSITKLLNDYIPDDDYIFSCLENTDIFKKLEKEVKNYRQILLKNLDKDKKIFELQLNKILKYKQINTYNICLLHPLFDILEFDYDNKNIIIGKNFNDEELSGFFIYLIYKTLENEYKSFKPNERVIVMACLELAIYNELYTRVSGCNRYNVGNDKLKNIKNHLLPYFFMYLGNSKEQIDKKLTEQHLSFEEEILYDESLKLMDFYSFINYVIKNKDNIFNRKYKIIKTDELL